MRWRDWREAGAQSAIITVALTWFCWREQFRRSARGRRELLFAHEASGTYVCTRELTHLESHPFLSLANRVSIGERYGYMSMVV